MKINPSNRKKWSANEKLAFIALLTMPQKSGKPKTVIEISKDYRVTPKTLYDWKNLFQLKGETAFDDAERKTSQSKSNNPELQEEIFNIALANPMFSAKHIIEQLSYSHKRITVPTVQKILKLRDLNTLKKRFIATEYAYVKKHLKTSPSTIDLLIKKNPFLRLLQINTHIEGSFFYIKCLDLSNFYEKASGYILLAVDIKVLTTFSQVWDGKYLDVPITFIQEISKIFGAKNGSINYFEIEENDIFSDIKKNKADHIYWFDSAKYYFSPHQFEIALSETLRVINLEFFKSYTFVFIEKFQTDLEAFLNMLSIIDGPLGYPAFGKSPYHLHKAISN